MKKFPFEGVTRIEGLKVLAFTIAWTRPKAAGCRVRAHEVQDGKTNAYPYADSNGILLQLRNGVAVN